MNDLILELTEEFEPNLLTNNNLKVANIIKKGLIKAMILAIIMAIIFLLIGLKKGLMLFFSVIVFFLFVFLVILYFLYNNKVKKMNANNPTTKYKINYKFYNDHFDMEYIGLVVENESLNYNEIDSINIYDDIIFVTKKIEKNKYYAFQFLNNDEWNDIFNILKPYTNNIHITNNKGKVTKL